MHALAGSRWVSVLCLGLLASTACASTRDGSAPTGVENEGGGSGASSQAGSAGASAQAGSSGGEGGAVSCGGLAQSGEPCASCASSACCDQATVCGLDKSCSKIEACLWACADEGCRAACLPSPEQPYPDKWASLRTCRAAACGDACGACGGWVFRAGECGACAKAMCCEQAAACAGSLDCSLLHGCLAACAPADGDCRSHCHVVHASGEPLLDKYEGCLSGAECGKVCPTGDLSCLGTVHWKEAPLGAVSLAVGFFDPVTTKPRPGLHVLACSDLSPDCTEEGAIGQTTTGADGVAGFVTQAAVGWLRVDGPAGSLPMLNVFRPPVSDTTILLLGPSSLQAAVAWVAPAAKIDPKAAQLHAFLVDCGGNPLQGAKVAVRVLDKAYDAVYTRANYVPDVALDRTGPTGEFRTFNIPVTEAEGFPLADITVTSAGTGATIARTAVRLRAGYWTELGSLPPTPSDK